MQIYTRQREKSNTSKISYRTSQKTCLVHSGAQGWPIGDVPVKSMCLGEETIKAFMVEERHASSIISIDQQGLKLSELIFIAVQCCSLEWHPKEALKAGF